MSDVITPEWVKEASAKRKRERRRGAKPPATETELKKHMEEK